MTWHIVAQDQWREFHSALFSALHSYRIKFSYYCYGYSTPDLLVKDRNTIFLQNTSNSGNQPHQMPRICIFKDQLGYISYTIIKCK
ncbi:hypothetical protein QE152_g36167 [Popillia japonica]|uniref:Uncharacterized protein n=1 Tax=Popillia japonica TaxID=7064 RepID=A0AAW1IDU0_POPJA